VSRNEDDREAFDFRKLANRRVCRFVLLIVEHAKAGDGIPEGGSRKTSDGKWDCSVTRESRSLPPRRKRTREPSDGFCHSGVR